MAISIEGGIRSMIDDGKKSLDIYWLEEVKDGEKLYWLDICEDHLGDICEMHWIWDLISKEEVDNDEDPESEYGSLESDIIVDDPFSEAVVKVAIEGWLKDRDLGDIGVNIISPDGTVASNNILRIIDESKYDFRWSVS